MSTLSTTAGNFAVLAQLRNRVESANVPGQIIETLTYGPEVAAQRRAARITIDVFACLLDVQLSTQAGLQA